MAKSERMVDHVAVETGSFDVDALMDQNLAELPETPEILGTWLLQFIMVKASGGVSAKGPWAMLKLFFEAIKPLDEDHEYTAANLENLPRVTHRVFYTTNRDREAFVKLAEKFGVEAGKLGAMIDNMRGEYIIATVKSGTDNRGEPETRLSNFRPATGDE